MELPCSECRVMTCVDFLVDCGDIAPLAGLCCPECERALLEERREQALEEDWHRRQPLWLAEGWK